MWLCAQTHTEFRLKNKEIIEMNIYCFGIVGEEHQDDAQQRENSTDDAIDLCLTEGLHSGGPLF